VSGFALTGFDVDSLVGTDTNFRAAGDRTRSLRLHRERREQCNTDRKKRCRPSDHETTPAFC